MSAALSRAERTEHIDRLLAGLTALRGVTAAAIVDSDGFVLQVRRDFEIDTDALGAGVQVVFSAASRASMQADQGDTNLVLTENADGMILLVPLAKGFVLAVLADTTAMLGALRYESKLTATDLNQLF